MPRGFKASHLFIQKYRPLCYTGMRGRSRVLPRALTTAGGPSSGFLIPGEEVTIE